MLIRSMEGSIEIVRGSFDDPWDLDASVSSRGFAGSVHNIFPTNAGAFFAALRAIERDHAGRAVLHGTEDFELSIEPMSPRGDFWVTIGMKLFGWPRLDGDPSHLLRCRLPVDGEYWYSTVTGLRTELVGYPPPAT